MANAPFSWHPSNLNQQGSTEAQARALGQLPGWLIPGGRVGAGDWCQVFLSYPDGSTQPVVHTAGRYLVHVVYTPDSDDARAHEDQSTTYGGPLNGALGANRLRNFHIDPGVAFQVPWDGQLTIIAGDESNDSLLLQVLLVRGFTPRNLNEQGRMLDAAKTAFAYGDDATASSLFAGATKPPREYAPPVIGSPHLVPATYVDIPGGTVVPFPDGAVQFTASPAPGPAVAAFRLTIAALGGAFSFDATPGIPAHLGAFAQGIACTNGTAATWSPNVNLANATILSSMGG